MGLLFDYSDEFLLVVPRVSYQVAYLRMDRGAIRSVCLDHDLTVVEQASRREVR